MTPSEKPVPLAEKVVLSPAEFAALFGRHATWAYRQIRAGRVKVVTETGRILIPRTEVGCPVILKLFGAVVDGNPGPATGVFIMGAFVRILKTSPSTDVIN